MVSSDSARQLERAERQSHSALRAYSMLHGHAVMGFFPPGVGKRHSLSLQTLLFTHAHLRVRRLRRWRSVDPHVGIVVNTYFRLTKEKESA